MRFCERVRILHPEVSGRIGTRLRGMFFRQTDLIGIPVPTFSGNRGLRKPAHRRNSPRPYEGRGRHRISESRRSYEMGRAYEYLPCPSGGNRSRGIDLQLNFIANPPEDTSFRGTSSYIVSLRGVRSIPLFVILNCEAALLSVCVSLQNPNKPFFS